MKATVLGVVPARLQSKRFPGKVLREVAGKPLVLHALDRLSEASSIDAALIATDSPDVEREGARFGAEVVIVSEPCATGTDRVARALGGREFEIAVNLQADQPLIAPADIDRLVSRLRDDSSFDVITLAYPDDDSSSFASRDTVKVVVDEAGRALYFSRAPIPSSKDDSRNSLFLHHVGIYCFRRAALERFAELPRARLEKQESLEQLRALEAGMAVGVLLTDSAAPDVDRPSDLEAVARVLGGR